MIMSEALTSLPKYGLSSLLKSVLKKPSLLSLVISLLVQFNSDLLPFLTAGEMSWEGPRVLMPTVYFGFFLTQA